MKLQYLSDSRDAFKWDLSHWLCTRSAPPYSHFLFVPMLTPDDPLPTDGRTPHERFDCRPEIRTFLTSLSGTRSLDAVCHLGAIDPDHHFEVVISPADRCVGAGQDRAHYWTGWSSDGFSDVLVFVDPDNGFETRTQKGEKWVRHAEVEWLLNTLPDSSGVIVYQHRPRQRWEEAFKELREQLHYAPFASAVFEPNLAFVILTRTTGAARRLEAAARGYVANHGSVQYVELKTSEAPPQTARKCEAGVASPR